MENAVIARFFGGGGQNSLSSLTGIWKCLLAYGTSQNCIIVSAYKTLCTKKSGFTFAEGFSTLFGGYRKYAFTLAEVLITLGIIGVVAAMTLPALVNNYKEKEIITQVKKTYSSINQAIALAQTKYGTPGDNSGLFAASKDHVAVTKELATYFNGARYCDAGSNAKGCKDLNYKVKYATKLQSSSGNMNMASDMLNLPRIVLNNGAVLAIKSKESGCDEVEETGTSFNPDGTLQKDEDGNIVTWTRTRAVCAGIFFDVNGNKLPNQFGRDVYGIDVYRDRVGDSTWGAYGTQSLHNILMDKKNPFVYVNYNSGDKFEW